MASDKKVCPFSMASENIKRCHDKCMLLKENGKCLFVEFLKKQSENSN